MTLSEFYRRQLASWPQAAAAYEALEKIETRKVEVATPRGVCEYTLQHNPARVRSTGAKIDAASIAARPCFLCRKNRPKEQMVLMPGDLDSALSGMPYEILVNPFPIFPMHFTIPATEHTPPGATSGASPICCGWHMPWRGWRSFTTGLTAEHRHRIISIFRP